MGPNSGGGRHEPRMMFFDDSGLDFSKDGCSKPSFSRKKDGFEPKKHLFLEKPKKPKQNKKKQKKNIFSKTVGLGPPKHVFFWFSREFFFVRNHLFLEKRMVFRRVAAQKPSFLEKKMVSNQKKHLFLEKTKKNTSFGAPAP